MTHPFTQKYNLKIVVILALLSVIMMPGRVLDAASAEKKPPVAIEQAMKYLGFDKSHKQSLLKGKILSTGMPEMETLREELAVAAVMLVVKASMGKVVSAYLDGESFRQNSDIIEYKMIRDTAKGGVQAEADFTSISFTEKESSEVKKLLGFKGGSAFNLSKDEISQIRTIDKKHPKVREKVSPIYRRILLERYRSYFQQGLEGVEPYDRGGKKRASPRRELTVAISSAKLLENHFPDFYAALLKYPETVETGSKDEFYWFKTKMDGRPIFELAHYLGDIKSHYAIIAELKFYVGHTYNSMLTLIGCVPYEGGTMVFLTNRTFTNQVSGFGSSLKRSIGRRKIEDAIVDHFKKLRILLESGTTPPKE